MKAFFKRLYLLIFQIRYFFLGIFIKQNDNTILFIQEFPYTLDHIKKRYSNSLYNKLEIHPNEKLGSKIKKLLRAKYIYIDNYNVYLGYIPKKNKKVMQVWHGAMAIKKIGFLDDRNMEVSEKDKKRYQRVYDSVDTYICSSIHMKETFMNAFNQPEEKMEVIGYPKIDYYLDSSYDEAVEQIQIQNEYLLDRLNILYIPTFREEIADNNAQIEFINSLYRDFSDEYNILYKLHRKVKLDKKQHIEGKEILNKELEKMIRIADIIITDYSSIVVEALLEKKALIYYLYDYDNYKVSPGLNVDIEELPGVKAYNYEEVAQAIAKGRYRANTLEELPAKVIPTNLDGKQEMITAKIIKKTLEF